MAKDSKKKNQKSARAGGYKDKYRRFQVPMVAWIFAGILVAVVVVIVLASVASTPNVTAKNGQPIPTSVASELTSIAASTWNPVGIQNAEQPEVAHPVVTSAPAVVFIGGEYCPYCAATRWSLTIALSRFGTFSGLKYMHSSSTDAYPNTPTVSYASAHYKSPYIKADLVEEYNRQGLPLNKLTTFETKLLTKYDVPPYVPSSAAGQYPIPFIMIGGRYLWISSPYLPSVLSGASWSAILGDIRSGQGPIAAAILANANEFTAAICKVDDDKPASVCNQSGINTGELILPNVP